MTSKILTDLIGIPRGINHEDSKSMLTNPNTGEKTRIWATSNLFFPNAKVKPNPIENRKKKIATEMKRP
jgi:hypothetical protein